MAANQSKRAKSNANAGKEKVEISLSLPLHHTNTHTHKRKPTFGLYCFNSKASFSSISVRLSRGTIFSFTGAAL